jgi:hypothetical protein
METSDWIKLVVTVAGIVFVAGFVLAMMILGLGGQVKEFDLGPAKIEFPTDTPPTTAATAQQTSESTVQPTSQSVTSSDAPTPSDTTTSAPVVDRLVLGSDVPLAPLMQDLSAEPPQISQTDLEDVIRQIQEEASRIHSRRVEGNSVDLPKGTWWLVWCSHVSSEYHSDGLPVGWSHLLGERLSTPGQMYLVSPQAENRRLDECMSPFGWWGVAVYITS